MACDTHVGVVATEVGRERGNVMRMGDRGLQRGNRERRGEGRGIQLERDTVGRGRGMEEGQLSRNTNAFNVIYN